MSEELILRIRALEAENDLLKERLGPAGWKMLEELKKRRKAMKILRMGMIDTLPLDGCDNWECAPRMLNSCSCMLCEARLRAEEIMK